MHITHRLTDIGRPLPHWSVNPDNFSLITIFSRLLPIYFRPLRFPVVETYCHFSDGNSLQFAVSSTCLWCDSLNYSGSPATSIKTRTVALKNSNYWVISGMTRRVELLGYETALNAINNVTMYNALQRWHLLWEIRVRKVERKFCETIYWDLRAAAAGMIKDNYGI